MPRHPEIHRLVLQRSVDRHAEKAGECRQRQKQGREHIQPVGGVCHALGALSLRLGLLGHGEVQAELSILQQQLGIAFDAGGLVTQIDQIAICLHEFAGLLQCAMQSTRGTKHRRDGFEDLVILGRGLRDVLGLVELVETSGEGIQVILQRQRTASIRARFPCTVRLPPKEGWSAGGIIRSRDLVKDDKQVLLFQHGTLRAGLAAHPVADRLRDGGPELRDDLDLGFHGRGP